MNGFINLYKERGFTSHDCVSKLRRIIGQKKIGHMGTLDPEAEGVLPVALGKATRLIELFDDDKKTYRVTMRLGITTDTLDLTGKVLEEHEVCSDAEQIRSCLLSFLGESEQVPPMYSALKKDGKRLYELAREGISIEREARKITIYEIVFGSFELPKVCFDVTCSRGTYIRSLCDDAGRKIGCGACMEKLIRLRVGMFAEENSFTLADLEKMGEEGRIGDALLPMTDAFPEMVRVRALPEADVLLHNGNPVHPSLLENSEEELPARIWLIDSADHLVGIYEKKADRLFPLKMVYED